MPKLPRVTARNMVAALKRAGFVERRQTGSHLILRHQGTRRMTVVPQHTGTMGAHLTRSILRQAGLTANDLRQLLGKKR